MMSRLRRYTPEERQDMEEREELYVCPHCDHHGHVDDFGPCCPLCLEDLDEDDITRD